MCPFTHVSFLTLGVTVVASFIFGFLWYGPIFGKTWAQLMGLKMGDKDCKPKPQALLLTLLGVIFSTIVMGRLLYIYKPSCSLKLAFLVWLGFNIPILFSQLTWEGKPWKLFVLNAAYYLLNLQLIAAILTYVHL